MTKEQNKKFFFIFFERLFNDSDFDDPYEYLIMNFDPIMNCDKCPLKGNCDKYDSYNCLGALKKAFEKGDLKL